MNEVVIANDPYPHQHIVSYRAAEVPANGELKASFGGAGVYNAKIIHRMLLEKIFQNKF